MSLTSQILKEYAQKELHIDLIGIAEARKDPEGEKHLQDFIDAGHQGDMHYLEDYKKRVQPEQLLPGAQSVIVIGINYYREHPPTPKDQGRIARYAYGRDYHKVLRKLLKQLAKFIEQQAPEAQTKICVDSAPLLEKSYAQKAGLGFIGKNTTLITKEFGSFILLGELLTTLKLTPDQPADGTCGTCTRCLDACPTQAIIGPGELNATSCISYLTIEKKGDIPEQFHKPMRNLIFGCDICQEVCPYNKQFAKPLQLEEFKKVTIAGSNIPLQEILSMETDVEYLARFAGSPLMRTKLAGLKRNAKIAAANNLKT